MCLPRDWIDTPVLVVCLDTALCSLLQKAVQLFTLPIYI